MSKSKGNFLTLSEMAHKYGTNASRIALGDAGDGISDGNFDEDLNLLIDQLFDEEMNLLTHECRKYYEETFVKLALKSGLEATTAIGIRMHAKLVLKYVELQALLISPTAPHWSEYIWQEVMQKPSQGSVAFGAGSQGGVDCRPSIHPHNQVDHYLSRSRATEKEAEGQVDDL
ncbi:hypothetical protein BFW01_g1742 [Lasiodiplodia theobromae]|nr:hypothetical protein BFW01_g1742 [Lasiodiplodia theobromae]